MTTKTILIFFLLTVPFILSAQITEYGLPPSFHIALPSCDNVIVINAPDLSSLRKADNEKEKDGLPLRVGICIPVQKNLEDAGQLHSLPTGGFIIRMSLRTIDNVGSVLYYDEFRIPVGGRLFLYSADKQHLLGAYTSLSNPSGGAFATPFIPGQEVVLEYHHPGTPSSTSLPTIDIEAFSFIYRPHGFVTESKGFGGSQWCEVNINCPEGDSWKSEKRGIARILLKAGGGTFWCSGSLVNNTAQNLAPYFLTADHCGQDASVTELNQWIFSFNYEAPGCQNPTNEPGSNTITGCERLASSGGSNGSILGSDFFLVRLSQSVPPQFNPYYNGWNTANTPSQGGVSIHHPAGDIKKISTYTQAVVSTQWGSTTGTHWGVTWAATVSNHGVTEGGSSGSPLFDNQKRIVGVLSGGDASCSNLTSPDLFGKLFYAWDQHGPAPDQRLKNWLDPLGTGTTSLPGTYGNVIYVIADFRADTTVIPVNSQVSFTDMSFGDPVSWQWEFEGGNPKACEQQNPKGILYEHTGTFTVKLTASNGETIGENTKLAYIRVIPNIYPNPVWRGEDPTFYIDFGKRDISGLELYLYDAMGKQQRFLFSSAGREGLFRIELQEQRSGMYLLRIHSGADTDGFKLMLLK